MPPERSYNKVFKTGRTYWNICRSADTFNLIHTTLFSHRIGNQNKKSQWHFFSPIGKFDKIVLWFFLLWVEINERLLKCNFLSSQLDSHSNALKVLSYLLIYKDKWVQLKGKTLLYFFFTSRALLGQAMGVKRGSLMVMIRKHDDFAELFQECKDEVEQLPTVAL